MTLVAAFEVYHTPVMLGDLMITNGAEPTTRKKIVRLRPNLAVGWSDRLIAARVMLKELDERLPRTASIEGVTDVLRSTAHEIGNFGLELTGWVLGSENTAFRWSSDNPEEVATGSSFCIGSGASWFSRFMRARDVSGPPASSTVTTREHVSFQALTITGNLMKSELSTRELRPFGFGFGYEILVADRGVFRYVSPVVYAMTRVNVDAAGVVQSPFSSSGIALVRNVGEFTIRQSTLFSERALDIDLISPPIARHSTASRSRIERAAIGPDRLHMFDGSHCVLFTQLYEDEKPWPPLVGVIPRSSPVWLGSDHRGVRLSMDNVIQAAAEIGKRRMGRW